jgi:hypothetical protein
MHQHQWREDNGFGKRTKEENHRPYSSFFEAIVQQEVVVD